MKFQWGDPKTQKFITNVGLITSSGPHGHDIMACEWTNLLSYDPALMSVGIGKHKATYENIVKSKEFGVSLGAFNQNVISSVAGNHTGKQVDKIGVLKDLGTTFFGAKTIDVLLVKGAAMTAECKLIKEVDIGDHPILIGEVTKAEVYDVEPLAYSAGKYYQLGEQIAKPDEVFLKQIDAQIKKHQK